MKYPHIIILVLFLVGLVDAFYLGTNWKESHSKPQIVEVIKEVPVERIVRVEVPIEVIKEVPMYIDKIVTEYQQVPYYQKGWQSVDEFLSELPPFEYFSGGCLGIAEMLKEHLILVGYPVSIAVTWNGYYYGKRVTDAPDGHAGLLVGIQGSYYFYDPETKQVTELF